MSQGAIRVLCLRGCGRVVCGSGRCRVRSRVGRSRIGLRGRVGHARGGGAHRGRGGRHIGQSGRRAHALIIGGRRGARAGAASGDSIRSSGGRRGRVLGGRLISEMSRYEFGVEVRLNAQLVLSEVEERREVAAVGQLVAGLAELVEEGVSARLQRGEPGGWVVLEQLAYEVDGLGWRAWTEHLVPRVGAYLRELELLVVGVHLADLLPGRRAQHLDDLHELVHARVAREDRLTQKKFG